MTDYDVTCAVADYIQTELCEFEDDYPINNKHHAFLHSVINWVLHSVLDDILAGCDAEDTVVNFIEKLKRLSTMATTENSRALFANGIDVATDLLDTIEYIKTGD